MQDLRTLLERGLVDEISIDWVVREPGSIWALYELASLLAEDQSVGAHGNRRLAARISVKRGSHVSQLGLELKSADERAEVLAHSLDAIRGRNACLLERWVRGEDSVELQRWHGNDFSHARNAASAIEHLRGRGYEIGGGCQSTFIRRARRDGKKNRFLAAAVLPLAPLAGRRGLSRAKAMLSGEDLIDVLEISAKGIQFQTRLGDEVISEVILSANDILGVTGAVRPHAGGTDVPMLRAVSRVDKAFVELFVVEDEPMSRALSDVVLAAIAQQSRLAV